HQGIWLVAGREHLVSGELDLVPGNARGGARGSANFRREIRERRQVIAVQRRFARELGSGQLHAVAGIAREPHDCMLVVARSASGSLALHQGSSDAGTERLFSPEGAPAQRSRTTRGVALW